METKQINEDRTLKDLGQYYGTENYYKIMTKNVTDGIIYLMKNGYSWFITDILSVVLCKQKVSQEDFLGITLKVDLENHTAKLKITDGNETTLYTQNYNYTDAKVTELKLFFTNEVLMLAREY